MHPNDSEKKSESYSPFTQYDSLTSLPNRFLFNETLNKTISHAKRRNKVLAILMLDLEYSTPSLSQAISDEILKVMAHRFSTTLRHEDILARLDGNEFIILLNDIVKPKFASAVAEKLLASCVEAVKVNSVAYQVTLNIGICIYPNDGDSLEQLLSNANDALFKAKQQGKAHYQFYTHGMDLEAREYIKYENALRKAIENNELTLYFQPKMSLKKGAISGVEALLRWEHPELGLIQPSQFIPLAEEIGMMLQIGEWTLREACKLNKYWQDEGYEHITVAVNLSTKQFQHPSICNTITSILEESGLNAKYLELEISEKTVMDSLDIATTILNQIKSTGIQLSIDHFGVGTTSISHLKHFPINTIKIDPSYIKGVPNIPDDLAITNAMIGLAHNLGFEVVAEGVETAEQVQYLTTQDCDVVQGYYLSHPLPAHKIITQFRKLIDSVPI